MSWIGRRRRLLPVVVIKTIDVPWVRQEAAHLCGPAVAQMILGATSRSRSRRFDLTQEALWSDIKAATRGRRPTGRTAGCSEAFPNQKCERCVEPRTPVCWCSTPQALARVINTRLGSRAYRVRALYGSEMLMRHIVDSVDRRRPAAVLVRGFQHWVVLYGYRETASATHKVGRRSLSGFYVLDPQQERRSPIFVSCDTWFDEYLRVVPCGMFRDRRVALVG